MHLGLIVKHVVINNYISEYLNGVYRRGSSQTTITQADALYVKILLTFINLLSISAIISASRSRVVNGTRTIRPLRFIATT